MNIRVGVLGLGKIAAGYGKPTDAAPYCHVGGIMQTSAAELAAVADVSAQSVEEFRGKWGSSFPGVRIVPSLAELLAGERLDVLAICVRGPAHYDVCMQAMSHANAPRALFLEKPPTCSLVEADALLKLASTKRCTITVSYSRHWAPHVLKMEELVRDGLIGKVERIVGYCGGLTLSFASHTTDLICQFAGGRAKKVYAFGHRPESQAPPGYEVEPKLRALMIEFDNGVIGTQSGGPGEYDQFYVDLFGTAGHARVGMYTPPFAQTKDRKPIEVASSMPANRSVFAAAYEQIAANLAGGAKPACSDEDFLHLHQIGFAAIDSMDSGLPVAVCDVRRDRRVFANG